MCIYIDMYIYMDIYTYIYIYIYICVCKPSEADNLKSVVVNCITDISAWISSHRLKINPTKTEFIWLTTSRRNHIIDHSPISVTKR